MNNFYNEMKQGKQILTRRGEVKYLTELFNCSKPTVIKALDFRRNTELSMRIRKAALERGGVETNN